VGTPDGPHGGPALRRASGAGIVEQARRPAQRRSFDLQQPQLGAHAALGRKPARLAACGSPISIASSPQVSVAPGGMLRAMS